MVDKDGQENIISLDGKRGQIRPGVAMKDIILQSASDDAHPSFKFDIDISNTTVDIDVLHKVKNSRFSTIIKGSSNHFILLLNISGSSSHSTRFF